MGFLDLLFPKKCVACKKQGSYVCESCFATLSFDVRLACVVCNRSVVDGLTHPGCIGKYTIDGVFCGVTFNRVARKLLYALKYRPYVSDVGMIMTDLLYEGLIQQERFASALSRTHSSLVPVPLSKARYRKRGYNHAKIIAENLGKKFNLSVEDSLVRVRETKPQFGLKREERKENVRGAFGIRKNARLEAGDVFLVDDVFTSGATFAECANVLKRNGVKKVWGIAFAREQNF